jgi:hypothetical protein
MPSSTVSGMFTSPPAVPAKANMRFGHVSPGTEQNHLSHTQKRRARKS